MRLIHTSDWHLGLQLKDMGRDAEHRAFLAWLADVLAAEQADALIVAGDIYDHANPASSAQAMLFQFLADLHRRMPPHFRTVLIGGNHDSAIRLDAPIPLLDQLRVHVVGGLPRRDGDLDLERLLVTLHDAHGPAAVCAAVPYLRPADLPRVGADDGAVDPLIEGMRARYAEVFDAAAARADGLPLVATGHCYMTGGTLSEWSERRILGGNQHALPVDIFPESLAYVALGHLHKAQRVGGRDTVRYCGAPLPLSFGEAGYTHQVLVVDLARDAETVVRSLPIPRFVDMLRLGPLPLDELEVALKALPDLAEDVEAHTRPFMEVQVVLEHAEPGLARRIEEALAGKAPRLVKITRVIAGAGGALADNPARQSLEDVTPEDVFAACYRQKYDADPPEPLARAFGELTDALEAV